MSCHGTEGGATATMEREAGTPVVALVGNPNVGKSTLFNALTGGHQRVGNWPGKTVSVAQGDWRTPSGRRVRVADLPGSYSLLPDSPDEALVRDVLTAPAGERPDAVVFALDAANPARNLYLLSQILDTDLPVVVALTMTDVAARRGTPPDPDALARELALPVVRVEGRTGTGLDLLADAVADALAAGPHGPSPLLPVPLPLSPSSHRTGRTSAWAAGSPVAVELATLVAEFSGRTPHPARWLAVSLLCGERPSAVPAALAERARQAADRLAEASGAGPQGATGAHADANTEAGAYADIDADAELLVAEARYAWAHAVVERAAPRPARARPTLTDRVDRLLLSRSFGIPFFLAVMWGVFQATTVLAKPLQDGLGDFVSGPVSGGADRLLEAVRAPGWLTGLLVDGLISGVGQLLTFVPLMIIMFVLLALLEDSGYFARAAFVADRLMRALRLPGRAFLPLVVGFGCNVPAFAGTRILNRRSHRLLVGLLIPYMSCTARLAVYVMIAGIFFGSNSGTVVFFLYAGSVLLVVLMGLILRPLLFKDMKEEPLVLELPPYRLPTLRVTGAQVWQKLAAFLRTAGGIIVATAAGVWLLMAVPAGAGHGGFGDVGVEHSVFGTVTRAVAPVVAPAGFGDWHATAALGTGLIAKEGVVSTLAQTYSAGEDGDPKLTTSLHATFDQASGGHPRAAALAFLVFILSYTPCMASLAAQRAEIGTRLTLIGFGIQLAAAWLLAVGVFQIARLMW
ncbi:MULTISPECIES: ferrous iron transport protein B [unclassified Streptomyces]|uniref:ferrous iron transport protein B n=1 Tax=unclassified Streptomyces TaxID=2593676 RepID=UPI000DC76FB8|nr:MULTISPECIES: ferrous iron transport protein B [unclassified Streptomyces]AWZ08509.1 ferrous iron transport protein B [Streptomyces sp. ICC4]AWZ16210.1 ferrous iron transport protein B [Streptomyces sp. ICC1]